MFNAGKTLEPETLMVVEVVVVIIAVFIMLIIFLSTYCFPCIGFCCCFYNTAIPWMRDLLFLLCK